MVTLNTHQEGHQIRSTKKSQGVIGDEGFVSRLGSHSEIGAFGGVCWLDEHLSVLARCGWVRTRGADEKPPRL
jgi:hypothetical protein